MGADYSLADVGTKNLPHEDSAHKLLIMEVPVDDHAIGPKAIKTSNAASSNLDPAHSQSKKGDGEPTSPLANQRPGHLAPSTHRETNGSHANSLIHLDEPITDTLSHGSIRGSSIISTEAGTGAGSQERALPGPVD